MKKNPTFTGITFLTDMADEMLDINILREQYAINKYNELLTFVKKEISLREHASNTNEAVLLDNEEKLLKETGEL